MEKKDIKSVLQNAVEQEIPASQIDLWSGVKARLAAGKHPFVRQGEKMKSVPARRLQRIAFTMLMIVLLVTLALVSPPGRALAQDIIHRIGNLIITGESSDAEKYVATLQSNTPTPTTDPSRVCTDCSEPVPVGLLTIAQASVKAGFPVYGPKYIPVGYRLSARDVLSSGGTITVDASYRIELNPPLHDGLQMAGMIAIDQTLVGSDAQPWEKGVGGVPIVEVTVRGQPGIWLEQIPVIPFQNQEGEWDYARWNQLVWAEEVYNFMIQTNMPADILSLDELLKVAESLTP